MEIVEHSTKSINIVQRFESTFSAFIYTIWIYKDSNDELQ